MCTISYANQFVRCDENVWKTLQVVNDVARTADSRSDARFRTQISLQCLG